MDSNGSRIPVLCEVFKGKEADLEVRMEILDRYLEKMDHIFLLNRRFHPVIGIRWILMTKRRKTFSV